MATIPLIRVRGTMLNADAPTADSISFDNLIGSDPHVTDWFTPKASKVTLSGSTIVSMTSRKIGSANTLASRDSPFQKAAWSAGDSNFNGRPSIAHDSGGSGDELLWNGTFPVGGNFFKVAIIDYASAPGGTTYFGLSSATSGNRHLFTANATKFFMRVGASGTEALAQVDFRTGLTCVIGTWNLAAKRARISIDLGASWTSGVNASAVVDVITGMQVGHVTDVSWTDQLWGDIDLSDGSSDSVTTLTNIVNYARKIVGVTV